MTKDGIKGKDDCIDTISMLQYMNPWAPAEKISAHKGPPPIDERKQIWGSNGLTSQHDDESAYGSYVT